MSRKTWEKQVARALQDIAASEGGVDLKYQAARQMALANDKNPDRPRGNHEAYAAWLYERFIKTTRFTAQQPDKSMAQEDVERLTLEGDDGYYEEP